MNNQTPKFIIRRFFAALIDYSVVFCFTFYFIMAFGTPNDEGGYSVTGFLALVPSLFWFTFVVMMEVFFNATVGNTIMQLKPKSLTSNHGNLSFSQSIKRHLLDPIDMFPLGLIGYITIKNTEKNQRLGDIWAKTTVVENKLK
jgi:uncharacterized RDD family membrane protein YckC